MIRALTERLIAKQRDGQRRFFDAAIFPWTAALESEWGKIRTELNALLTHAEAIPNFQDVSEDQKVLTAGTDWKTYFFHVYGHKVEENCRRCPETARLLAGIPGMKTAMFSILAPGKHIPEHRGPYKGVLRYHLGLIVPDGGTRCRIRVDQETRQWEEGKSLIFDDSYTHEVWNDSDLPRVVLFVDFLRPLPVPLLVEPACDNADFANRVRGRRGAKNPHRVCPLAAPIVRP